MRQSQNITDSDGNLKHGFDYELQVWVKDYIILPCGHPQNMKPECCIKDIMKGQDIREVKGQDIEG